MLKHRYFTLLCGALTLIGLVAAALWHAYTPGPKSAKPLLLDNEDGRCAANAILQAFYALTSARGWHPEHYSSDDVARCWLEYTRGLQQQDPRHIASIDILGNLEPLIRNFRKFDRYEDMTIPAAAIARWLQITLPQGSQKIAVITLNRPTKHSTAEHAHIIEQELNKAASRLPEALVVLCDYSHDAMYEWENLFEPDVYAQHADQILTRPFMPVCINVGTTQYRISSFVHSIQQAIPTSAAGKFILTHASEAWKKLNVYPAAHATACIRQGEQWFEVDDMLRYKIWSERPGGTVNQNPLVTDLLVSERHPGVPAACIYERWDGKTELKLPETSTDELSLVWSCPSYEGLEVRKYHEILHNETTCPHRLYRRFDQPRRFLPA